MNIKKHIPNLITLINLFCGCVAVVFVSKGDFLMAFYMVCLGIFFDFFDGFFARLFKVSSPLGLQLDSLADMVTSGVVPGYVMYSMFARGGDQLGNQLIVPFLGFIITLGACYRLANFNIDTRQTDSFIGLPTPANAIFIISLQIVLDMYADSSLIILELLTNQWVLLLITLGSAYIMNAEIPLFSLKIKKFSLKENALQIVFLIVSVLLVVLLHYIAIPLIIVFYVLLSIINNLFLKK
jgi:CDP-diacylglycerol--serine O-phosphatidyltransferase